jgi:hypothetical protein
MNTKFIKPTESYGLFLPPNILHRADKRVSSFWRDGDPVLLQTSSYSRGAGAQISASDRLQDRIAKHDVEWHIWVEPLIGGTSIDQAIGEFEDVDGTLWVHAYFVWPHLTVYATVSGPAEKVRDRENWAWEGLKSITLNTIH